MEHETLGKGNGCSVQSWNFTIFAPRFYQICAFFVEIKKFSTSLELEGMHFPTFSQNVMESLLEP